MEPNHPSARPAEAGVDFFLDKIEETMRACDNLLLTQKTHGTPLGDRKVNQAQNGKQDTGGNRAMERKFEHGRYPDLPHLHRNIP